MPYPPTAVVVPIKREVVDLVSKAEGGQGIVVGEKCSLPPFETLVTTHRPSPLTSEGDSGGSSGLEAAILQDAPGGPYARPSIADRCPTVQKILLMNQNAQVRVRLPGIQQLFQTHSAAGAGCISTAAAVSEATNDVCRGIPTDLSYYHSFRIAAMSSPSPVTTSSPILPIGTDFVRENTPHRTAAAAAAEAAAAAGGDEWTAWSSSSSSWPALPTRSRILSATASSLSWTDILSFSCCCCWSQYQCN